MRATRSIAALVALALVLTGSANAAAQPANATATALLEFHKRLEAYEALRQRATDAIPKLAATPSPEEIGSRERAQGKAIRSARAQARAGDLFGPVESLVRRIVRDDWARRSAADRRALAEEVPRLPRILLNMDYPLPLPLATVPATLLQELPKLTPSLEYRFIGRSLVLRDSAANVIVDVLEKALPSR